MHGALMVCGTSSDAGKSTVVTGLCRLLARHGVKVAPFKGQNMSLNAMVTPAGGEIGRAQWLQAVAARAEPEVAMNPVLLKPTSERASQVVLMGRPLAVQDAATYRDAKHALVDAVDAALADLRARFDVVVCEGAGSPAEINLFADDIVNLGLARRAAIPAVLVGDIERGGVFAHLYGTVALLPADLAALVHGFVINRFRGDPALLGTGPAQLEERCGVPTLGVLPHLGHLALDAEDSLALERPSGLPPLVAAGLDVAVLRLPRLANFTDIDPLVAEPGVSVRWVARHDALGDPDLVIIPGTRSTIDDLSWLRATGLAAALDALRSVSSPPPVIVGICGGFQMMGEDIDDPDAVESSHPSSSGLGWLPVRTTFAADKVTRLTAASLPVSVPGAEAVTLDGYEIRHGRLRPDDLYAPWFDAGDAATRHVDDVISAVNRSGAVRGTTLHGVFENNAFRSSFLADVAARRGRAWEPSGLDYAAAREEQIERVADACEEHLDLERVWRIVERGALNPRGGRA
ncbi:MAG TPA: cobyric acid synthase [Acidimicrobiales bacterium]